jgi:oxygen-dependent protoporphyrinogen oxidase
MARIVIVGAGISGLTTAFHLQTLLPAADVTVLEANQRAGGTIWTERRDGFQVEIGANGFLDSKPTTLELCHRLGLKDRIVPAREAARNRYLFLDGRLQALPNSLWTFLRSPLLSWRAKLALLTERFRAPRSEGGDE